MFVSLSGILVFFAILYAAALVAECPRFFAYLLGGLLALALVIVAAVFCYSYWEEILAIFVVMAFLVALSKEQRGDR